MFINKKYLLHEAVAQDDSRPVLSCIQVFPRTNLPDEIRGIWETDVAAATNGFTLVVVPVTMGENDVPGLIPGNVWKEACKGNKNKSGVIHMDSLEHVRLEDGAMYPRPEGRFPDFWYVLPKNGQRPEIGKALHPGLVIGTQQLLIAARAIGLNTSVRGGRPARISFTGEKFGEPLVVEPSLTASGRDSRVMTSTIVPPFAMVMGHSDNGYLGWNYDDRKLPKKFG